MVLAAAILATAALLAVPAIGASIRHALIPPVRTSSAELLPLPAPSGGQPLSSTRAPAASPGTTIDPGYSFNLIGFVSSGTAAATGRAPVVRFRTSADGSSWSSWSRAVFERAENSRGRVRWVADPFWCGTTRYLQYTTSARVKAGFVNSLGNADAGERVATALRKVAAAVVGVDLAGVAAAATEKPAIVTRAQWGANESWRTGSPRYGTVKFAVVHHTLGRNTYTQAEAPSVMRAIYSYHARTCGFSDIGYNFLIDRFGTIYEGRYGGVTKAVAGAQCMGFNEQSTGVSLIGDFTSTPPPTAAVAALERLLAWKLDIHHIDPASTVTAVETANDRFKAGQTVHLPAICPHRVAAYTDCPGDAFMAIIPTIRKVVADTGLPKIYGLLMTPQVFSPNGDGLGDQTQADFITSEPCNWTMNVIDANGTPLRTFTGSGQTVAVPWDGLDGNGRPVADGVYTITVDASGLSGVARQAATTVTVDTSLPTLTVENPTPAVVNPSGGVSGTSTTVKYSINEPCLAKAVIRDSAGKAVTVLYSWKSVAAGQQTVTWDGRSASGSTRTPLAEGQYQVEIAIKDGAGNKLQQSVPVVVDRTLQVTDVAPLPLSPDGNGAADTVALPFSLARKAAVTMAIVGKSGTVRTVVLGSLKAGDCTAEWDGHDNSGRTVKDGTYAVVLKTSRPAGTVMAAGKATVDTAAPVIAFSGSKSVKKGKPATVWYRPVDAGSPVTVTVKVRSAAGKLMSTSKAVVVTGKRVAVRFVPRSRGAWRVSVAAVDWAGNRLKPVAKRTITVR